MFNKLDRDDEYIDVAYTVPAAQPKSQPTNTGLRRQVNVKFHGGCMINDNCPSNNPTLMKKLEKQNKRIEMKIRMSHLTPE